MLRKNKEEKSFASQEQKDGEKKKEELRKCQLRLIRDFCIRLGTMLLVLYVMFFVAFGVTIAKNNDMNPGFGAGDLVLFYRLKGKLDAGDVVTYKVGGNTYIGRIIAKAGDSVEVTADENVMINGYLVAEPKIFTKTPRMSKEVKYPLTLSADSYFIMCDQRETSRDSRYFGPVCEKDITGKVMTVVRRANL